jgi:hypothetical protein
LPLQEAHAEIQRLKALHAQQMQTCTPLQRANRLRAPDALPRVVNLVWGRILTV